MNLCKAGAELVGRQRQRRERATGKFPEQIGLRVPIERLGPGRVAFEAVLCARVIGEGNLGGAESLDCRCSRQDGAPYLRKPSWTTGAAPPRPKIVSTFLRTA